MEENCKECRECRENCIGKTPCSYCRVNNNPVKEALLIMLAALGAIAAVWVLDLLQFVYYGR